MNTRKLLFAPVVAALTCAVLLAAPMAQAQDGSDAAFNEMLETMKGRDTGSMWFDYYVERLNMEMAYRTDEAPYGAAGPEGPVADFDAYVESFIAPDTGSMWFNQYVDSVNRNLREKEAFPAH